MLSHQSKGIIIVGCSLFDMTLANTLYHRGHKVVVLDKDGESFRYLLEELGGSGLEGDPTNLRVSKETGTERAEMIAATTRDDNSDLLISQVAGNIFQVGCVYAKLDGTSRYRLITDMSIRPISPYNLSVDDYKDLVDSMSREVAV